MSQSGILRKQSDQSVLLENVRWCSSFLCRLKGLMFRSSLDPGEGLLLVEAHASRMGPGIHMLFMAFPIATVWLDPELIVVDMVVAKPWRPAYFPRRSAQYTLEAAPDLVKRVAVGDRLVFEAH